MYLITKIAAATTTTKIIIIYEPRSGVKVSQKRDISFVYFYIFAKKITISLKND